MFEVVPLAPTSTHSGVVDHPGIECNPAVLHFSIFSLCDSFILDPSQGEVSSMYKMCLSLSEKMIKSGRELKADLHRRCVLGMVRFSSDHPRGS